MDDALTKAKRGAAQQIAALIDGSAGSGAFTSDARIEAAHPWHRMAGAAACAAFFAELRQPFDAPLPCPDIVIAGENFPDARLSEPRHTPLVGWLGHIEGIFARPLLGIEPHGRAAHLRLAIVVHPGPDGRIARAWVIPDLLDLMDQADQWPRRLPQPLGARGRWPGPATGDGARLDHTDAAGGARRLAAVLAMHDDLHRFDGVRLESMPMGAWAPGFTYCAGGGIGICHGLEGFRAHHQKPFLTAFPDRRGAGHFVRIGDGPFALTGGRVAVTHLGPFLGVAATRRTLSVSVMDFYRFDSSGLIAENWLPIDMVGLLAQMGEDILPERVTV